MSAVIKKAEDAPLTAEQVAAAVAEARALLVGNPAVREFCQIGSSVYLPEPKDVDYIVRVGGANDGSDHVAAFCGELNINGWEFCGEYTETLNGWNSIRKGDVNLIVTSDPAQFNAYRGAMEVCRALHLTKKSDRRLVCRIIRDDMSAEDARALAASKGETDDDAIASATGGAS